MVLRKSGTYLWAGAVLALVASIVVSPRHLPSVPLCMFRWLTELPCPLCGLTRAFVALGHGDVAAAWGFHPFGILLFGLLALVIAWPLLRRCAPSATARVVASSALRIGIGGLVVGLCVFGVCRIVALA